MSGCNDHLGQGWCSWRAPPCRRGRRGGGPEFALIMAEPHDRQRRGCGLIQRGDRNISRSIAAPKGQLRDDVWSAAPGISSDLGTHSLHPWAGRQQTAGSSLHHNHSDQWSQLHHHVLFHSNLWPTAHNTTTTRGPRCLFPATRARPQIMIMPQIPSKKLQLRTAMHPHPSPFID